MIRRPPRSTLDRSSAAADVYKRQVDDLCHGSSSLIGEVAVPSGEMRGRTLGGLAAGGSPDPCLIGEAAARLEPS